MSNGNDPQVGAPNYLAHERGHTFTFSFIAHSVVQLLL